MARMVSLQEIKLTLGAKANHIGQVALAREIGIAQSTLSEFLSGSKPTRAVQPAILDYLKLDHAPHYRKQ